MFETLRNCVDIVYRRQLRCFICRIVKFLVYVVQKIFDSNNALNFIFHVIVSIIAFTISISPQLEFHCIHNASDPMHTVNLFDYRFA